MSEPKENLNVVDLAVGVFAVVVALATVGGFWAVGSRTLLHISAGETEAAVVWFGIALLIPLVGGCLVLAALLLTAWEKIALAFIARFMRVMGIWH